MVHGARLRRLVIVGAGTGVGKTHLGVTLARCLALQGEQVAALKPIESGVGPGSASDAEQLSAASTVRATQAPPYMFLEPISPHLAARRTGTSIELSGVTAWVDGCVCPWVLVETAGGLLSPLGVGVTNLDLAKALQPDTVILVALDRLGVLHEVSACCLALRVLAPELGEPLVVLQAPAAPDLSTGTNAEELIALGLTTYAFTLPRGGSTAPEVIAAASDLLWCLRA